MKSGVELLETEDPAVERLSRQLGLAVETLRSQREQFKLGWAELLIANRLAQKTGMSFEDVVREVRDGKGWGLIAREHQVNPAVLVSELTAAWHTTGRLTD